MDGFNPLDLLASAAELQQKNDDGPERIIITRQRRTAAPSKPGLTNGQKENRELCKNNNNYINKGKPNVVIVKKLKKVEVNLELEKMLDEHNYGNAKRTVNHEHSYGNGGKRLKTAETSVVEIHGHARKRADTEEFYPPSADPAVSSQTATITGGQSIDKTTTVISNTGSSQLSDSECINVRKCTVECSDKDTCSHTCVNRISLSSCKHEVIEENKCSNINNIGEGTCVHDNVNEEECLIDQPGLTSASTQSGDNDTSSLIMKCDNGLASETTRENLEHTSNTTVEDCLKLDEHTGEFISKKGVRFSVKGLSTDGGNLTDVNLNNSSVITNKIPGSSDSNSVDNELGIEVGSLKSVQNEGMSSVGKDLPKSTSKKMPYVKVITPEVISEPAVDNSKEQTLVINISGGRNSTDKLTNNATLNKPQLKSEENNTTESDKLNSNVGIVRSLIINDFKNNNTNRDSGNKRKSGVLSLMSPITSKLEMPHCSSHLLGEHSDSSCSSFKVLEFSDSVCAEDSTSSVHLLSPDRRNPDSMGIVESPVTQNVNELSNSGKFEDSCGRSFDYLMETDDHVMRLMPKCNDSCEIESPIKSRKPENVVSTSLHSNPSHSQAALEQEMPNMETVSDSRELSESNERPTNCDNSAIPSTSGTDIPIFRFDSDHCYAGMPRTEKVSPARISVENESSVPSEGEEARTPLGSTSELSQDSGYEDVTQSPEIEQPAKIVEEKPVVEKCQSMKNLVPVLVSVNSNGSLTVHDTDLTKTLSRQVFLPDNMKVISGSNITPISQPPLILSPVSVGKTSQVNLEVPTKLVQARPDSILELLSPKITDIKPSSVDTQESPSVTFGTFKIGTFASFSNTGMGLESPKKVAPLVKQVSEEKPKKVSPSNRSRSNSGKSGKSSPVVDTLGTLVQKVKSSLSPASSVDWSGLDHLQHDHDYCTKNLMPSVVSSFLEARLLSKDTPRNKVTHSKGKRSEIESVKSESKSGKRKKIPTSVPKDFMDDVDIDSEGEGRSIPEPAKQKYRVDKFIEPKRTDPKVKITGSSNFQDQFVYFMNTKKRSRRRESKDAPLPTGSERVFIPPKPGDIIVPHLTDQDIENLKIRSNKSKQPSANAGYNSLRNEFMAAKLSNGTFSTTQTVETVVDDEKNIINTILSLENEDLSSPVHGESPVFNESMEMYGQGLVGSDIMNLLPEQMNLTQEQMELLYSAVDEVQNESPGLIGTDKLVTAEAANSAFQFPITQFDDSNTSAAGSPSPAEVPASDDKLEEPTTPAESKLKDVDKLEETEQKDDENKSNEDENELKESKNVASSDGVKPTSKVTENIIPATNQSEEEALIPTNQSEEKALIPTNQSEEEALIPTNQSEEEALIPTNQSEEEAMIVENENSNIKPNNAIDKTEESELPSKTDKSIPTEPISNPASPSSSSGNLSLSASAAPFDSLTPSVSTSDAANTVGPGGDAQTDKPLFSTPSLNSELVTPSSFGSELSSVSSTPISSEISLPIDKSLDLLGNIRFDRGDLFSETSVPVGGVQAPATKVPTPSQVDYNAPWIVTVSMYWNDLPAIMINNQPFVRLVDIHKQILPAKDTGILKKRCQLMGIDVENCSEMQRYFLVQYGKAINSKSTLIISKEHAKVLIGYYVEPQPKAARLDDHHKSIIDHRREQLRRIALARRAAVRAQRLSEKKDEPDPREIKETATDEKVELPTTPKSQAEPTKRVEVPVVTSGLTVPHNTLADSSRSQRATRHKKINFLEMLRGDTTSQTTDDSLDDHKKSNNKLHSDSSDIKKKIVKERKVKIVKYSIETDSSEETESVESDFSSEYCDTDTSSEAESPVPQQLKQRKVPQKLVTKIKSKIKPLPNQYTNKPPLKLKLGLKRPKPTATSTPVPVQHVNKGTGTAAQVYRSKLSNKMKNYEVFKSSSPTMIAGKNFSKNSESTFKDTVNSSTVSTCENGTSTGDSVSEIRVESDIIIKPFRPEIADTHELKVSPTLPEDILQTGDTSDSHSSEISEALDTKNENVDDNATETKMTETADKKSNLPNGETSINSAEQKSSLSVAVSENGFRSKSPEQTNSAVSVLKRKGISQIGTDEVSVRIVHRDSSPLTEQRIRSQLGEVFVNRYHNKKSMCVRCYTCRKMMSVDNFLRHLHDISGGMTTLTSPQTIDLSEGELSETERKLWESFQRKKELFDNNQLPSPDIVQHNIVYDVESNSNGVVSGGVDDDKIRSGPRIINTPVSPSKKAKVVRKNKLIGFPKSSHSITNQITVNKKTPITVEAQEGVRTSSRKRKVKHLDGFEDYSFSKFPRLMKNAVVEEENN